MIARTLIVASLISAAAGPLAAQSAAPSAASADQTIHALQQAVAADPGDASLYARLSQTYATAGFGEAALHAIEAALALQPGRADYVRARATLATWVGEYRKAGDSYRQLEALYPDDLEIALALARVSAWA